MRQYHGGPEITLGGQRKRPKVQVASRTISKIALATETSTFDRGIRCNRDIKTSLDGSGRRSTIGPPAKMDSSGVMRKIIYRERPMGSSGPCYVIDPTTGQRKLDPTTGQSITVKGHRLTRSKAPRKTREARRRELSADEIERINIEVEMRRNAPKFKEFATPDLRD